MKKMLLITEGFYDYDAAIRNVFQQMGYDVELFRANLSYGYMEKLKHRADMEAYGSRKKQAAQVCLLEKEPYDVVLVICGHSLHVDTFLEFRKRQKQARFVLYLWDDVARVATFEALRNAFDDIYTFDRTDAGQYGLGFRPLFYLPDYCYGGQEKWRSTSCVGWLHSDRTYVLNRVLGQAFDGDDTAYVYLLTGLYTRCRYALKRLVMRRLHGSIRIATKKLDRQESARILLESRTVIDIQHPTQRGLTIRTLESLAAHTKLITTNEQVREYDFYRENNVCIIDRNNPHIPEEWLEEPWEEVDEPCVQKYSIEQWAAEVINGK